MEREYKFYFPPLLDLATVQADSFWIQWKHGPWTRTHHRATYYDDNAGYLNRAGIAIRLRQEGDACILTIKAPGSAEGSYSERQEWNFPWQGKRPQLVEVRDLLLDQAETERVVSILEQLEQLDSEPLLSDLRTDVYRTEALFELDDSMALVSMDSGNLYGGALSEPCLELEVEFVSGSESAFHKAVDAIQAHFSLLTDVQNKLARCLALRRKTMQNTSDDVQAGAAL